MSIYHQYLDFQINIFVFIVGEYLNFDNNQKEVGYLIELEVSGRVVDGKFLGGLRLLPIVEAKIETLTQQDFNTIFFEPDKSITIGKNLFDTTNEISLDINRLIPSHIGIFGNTGSGKSNTLAKIIKEGRKFGVFLIISSQRPSDISNTITSQLQNYFIHKLVNPNDIEKIRKTVAYMNEASLNMITVLGQGECIISGNALYTPQYAYIDELESNLKPNSADIILLGEGGILEE